MMKLTFSARLGAAALVFLALALFIYGEQSIAQTVPSASQAADTVDISLDEPTSKAAVRDMVSRLSDDTVRALLIERLDAVAEAHEEAAKNQQTALGIFRQGLTNWFSNAKRAALHPDRVPPVLARVLDTIERAVAPRTMTGVLLNVLIAIAIGVVAERAVAMFFRKRKLKLIADSSNTLSGILKILYTRLSFDIAGVLAFAAAAYLVAASFYDQTTLGYQFMMLFSATIMATWLAYVICRFFFAPRRPDLRICLTSDERAMRLTISFSLLAGYIVFIHHAFKLVLAIGIDSLGGWEQAGTLTFPMNLSMYVAAVFVIFYNRHGLTEILIENRKRVYRAIGEDSTDDNSWFARNWPTFAIVLVILKYALVEIVVNLTDVAVYSTTAVYITFIVIFLWPGIDANVSLFVGRGITTPEDETAAASKARRGMQQGLLRVGRVLVVCVVLYALASLWGVNLVGLAEAGLGAKVAGNLLELVLIGLFAYIIWELVSIIVGRWLANEVGQPDEHDEDPGGGDAGGVGLSRVATLLPIVRRTAQFLIITVSVIMVLNNWGVNIGPLLAGAGVVGLAIGFGAQTLVKDIVSGLFFLADDAFRVGEYIDVGGTMGNVEKISLRSLRLRHHRGLVHTIPYGEIPKLTNFSRDWVIMKLRFRVPFDTDVNKIKKIFKGIGKDLLQDPVLGEDFLQPFKSQGVAEVDDNGIVVRGKFMAKPGKQFMIRKELYVRVQKAFEEAGIPFARKQVMVHIPGLEKGETLDAESYQTIAAAAAENAAEAEDEAAKKAKT